MVKAADVINYIVKAWTAASALREDASAFSEAVEKISLARSELLVIETMRLCYNLDKQAYVDWLRKHNMLPVMLFIDFVRAREELDWPSHTMVKVSAGRIIKTATRPAVVKKVDKVEKQSGKQRIKPMSAVLCEKLIDELIN